jgi:hypothetical protein
MVSIKKVILMIFFVPLLLFAAKYLGRNPSEGSPSNAIIIKLSQDLSKLRKRESIFYKREEIVTVYATIPLDSNSALDAKENAELLLKEAEEFKDNWNYGNAVHHGNLVLGRVRLFLNDDLDGAQSYLNLAGNNPGSPQLNSFGPNMTLAKEILERGEEKAVLDYLDDCLNFWKTKYAAEATEKWKNKIFKGEIPDFGANLEY